MAWKYKDPKTFPADYSRAMLAAVAADENPIVLCDCLSRADAQVKAENFRFFKWCVLEKPLADQAMTKLLEEYDFRTAVKKELGSMFLTLRARPKLLSTIERLNPELAPIIRAIGQ